MAGDDVPAQKLRPAKADPCASAGLTASRVSFRSGIATPLSAAVLTLAAMMSQDYFLIVDFLR
jgi:hypothetical protein